MVTYLRRVAVIERSWFVHSKHSGISQRFSIGIRQTEVVQEEFIVWAVIVYCNCKDVPINPIINPEPIIIRRTTHYTWQYVHTHVSLWVHALVISWSNCCWPLPAHSLLVLSLVEIHHCDIYSLLHIFLFRSGAISSMRQWVSLPVH
jgi:hypothetical protein